MFDISWSELLIIGIVALVVIGPKDLPKVLRALGQMITKVRAMAGEFQGQFQEAMREAELSELKKEAEKLAQSTTGLVENPLKSVENEIKSSFDTPTQLQPTAPAAPPPMATDAEVNAVIPAPEMAPPVSVETAAIAPAPPAPQPQPEPVSKAGAGS
jgi:sec-independent protein translocase protein TatB